MTNSNYSEQYVEITTLLITLLVKSERTDPQILAVTLFLRGEEQRWQMALWLRRMMGENLDQKLEFREIWLQVEKIAEEVREDM